MDAQHKQIEVYRTRDNHTPFTEWHDKLKDKKAAAAIAIRLNRLRCGAFGDCKPVGDGVHELRIDVGSGYRVYFGNDGETLILLLLGGDKSSQNRDIKKAKEYFSDYRRRKNEQTN